MKVDESHDFEVRDQHDKGSIKEDHMDKSFSKGVLRSAVKPRAGDPKMLFGSFITVIA